MDGLTYRLGLLHSPFDKLRANGKVLNLMAVTQSVGTIIAEGLNSYG